MSKYYFDTQYKLAGYTMQFLSKDDSEVVNYFLNNMPNELKIELLNSITKKNISKNKDDERSVYQDALNREFWSPNTTPKEKLELMDALDKSIQEERLESHECKGCLQQNLYNYTYTLDYFNNLTIETTYDNKQLFKICFYAIDEGVHDVQLMEGYGIFEYNYDLFLEIDELKHIKNKKKEETYHLLHLPFKYCIEQTIVTDEIINRIDYFSKDKLFNIVHGTNYSKYKKDIKEIHKIYKKELEEERKKLQKMYKKESNKEKKRLVLKKSNNK